MCKYNILCDSLDGSCQCSLIASRPAFPPVNPVPYLTSGGQNILLTIYNQICQQNEIIKNLKETLSAALQRLERVQPISDDLTSTNDSQTGATTVAQLKKHLCGEATQRYTLEPVSELVNPAYKERAFSVLLQVVDADGKPAVLDKSIFCKIVLFTTENPPKVIKMNTVGDKILKGNTEVQGNSNFFFRNIAVKEVSSHFRNGCFFFVVLPSNPTVVAPYIVENFLVKARKVNFEVTPSKKAKYDQDIFTNNS